MIKEAIDRILELSEIKVLKINDRQYTTKNVHPVLNPMQTALEVMTLQGIVDYIKLNIDDNLLNDKSLFIHVVSNGQVKLLGDTEGNFKQRPTYMTATFNNPRFQFGIFHDVEEFIIGVQSFFVLTNQAKQLLKVVGNLKDEKVKTSQDDGFSQIAVAKTGITKVQEVIIENPIELSPYRTFPEIYQPESAFILRLRSGKDGNLPQCALFECDNGKWKIEAMERIKAWLAERLPNMRIIV